MESEITAKPTVENTAPVSEPPAQSINSTLGTLKRPPALGQTSWNEDATPKSKSMVHPGVRLLRYTVLGFFSFLIFLYLTFPYGVVKEVATTNITQVMQKSGFPVRVSVGTLEPFWFTGMKMEDVVISNVTDSNVVWKVGKITARVNILPLFVGSLNVSGRITQAGGHADYEVAFPISSFIKQKPGLKFAEVSFKSFSLDPMFNHLLAIGAASKDPGMMLVVPLVSKTSAGGSLSGNILFDNPDPSTFNRVKGAVDLNIAGLFLHIDDSTLKIPKQNFSTAKVDLKFDANNLNFGQSTKFEAEDIGIGLSGKVVLPDSPTMPSTADLDLSLTMHGQIEKSLGMIVPNLLRCKPLTNGELKAKLTGPVNAMSCT